MAEETPPSDLPADSKDRILCAAEREFTAKGFDGASTRDIAAEAGVSQASIHYHFNSKRALFIATVHRRAHIGNLAWETALAELPTPDLEGILGALFLPMQVDRRGAANYLRLLYILANGSPEDQELLTTLFDPTAILFVEAIRLAQPGLDAATAATGHRFAMGMLSALVMGSGRDNVLGGRVKGDHAQSGFRDAATFCAAGIRALAARRADEDRRASAAD